MARSMQKRASLCAALCCNGSNLREEQISAKPKYPAVDCECWVRYGIASGYMNLSG